MSATEPPSNGSGARLALAGPAPSWLREHRLRIGLVLSLAVLVAAIGGIASRISTRTRPQTITLATGTPGAAYAVAALAMKDAVEPTMRQDGVGLAARIFARRPPVFIALRETAGTHDNAALLDSGAVELAMLHGSAAASRHVRLIAKLYDSPMQIVARCDVDVQVADLCGKRLAIGPPDGTANRYARLLAGHFCDGRATPRWIEASFAEARRALERGDADAFFITTGLPVPIVEEIVTRPGMCLVSLGDANDPGGALQGFRVRHPEIKVVTIPERAYGSAPRKAVGTIATFAVLAVRDDVDAHVVEDLTRALFDHRAALVHADPLLAGLDATPSLAAIPLHPGARRFYEHHPVQAAEPGLGDLASVAGALLSSVGVLSLLRRDKLRVHATAAREIRAREESPPEKRAEELRLLLRKVMDEVETGKLPADARVQLFTSHLRDEIENLGRARE
jgi:TRAP transporter TAXI family solute receptor